MSNSIRHLCGGLLALALYAPVSARAADAPKPAAPAPAPATAPTPAPEAKPAAESKPVQDATSTGENLDEEKPGAKGPRTLADRIPPISGGLFVLNKRHELAPELGVSLNDAFFQKYMIGARYTFHINNSFAVGLRGAFGISTPSGTVNKCGADGCSAPTKDELKGTPGDIALIGGLDGIWSPLYGKLNILGEKVIHFDTFFGAGLDGIQYKKPVLNPGDSPASAFTFGVHAGVGQHFVINEYSALRVELRDYVYQGDRAVNGAYQTKLENQLMLELGFSFFFPLHPNTEG